MNRSPPRRRRICIVDAQTPFAYTHRDLGQRALGGTEATVLRVSAGLARRHEVCLRQGARPAAEHTHSAGVRLESLPAHWPADEGWDVIIVVRNSRLALRLATRQAGTPCWLWVHNFVSGTKARRGAALLRRGVRVVCVSASAAVAARQAYAQTAPMRLRRVLGLGGEVPVEWVYNPIDEVLAPDDTPVDPDKLLFLSSPNKGLDQVLERFRAVRRLRPSARLHLLNPGYTALEKVLGADAARLEEEGVVLLGSQPHAEVIRELRSAFCVFYPQWRFPETFGLVLADANAVGTPVLAHAMGAAPEVLADGEQLVDAASEAEVLARMQRWWTQGRPAVRGRPEFRLESVLQRWEDLLGALPARAAG